MKKSLMTQEDSQSISQEIHLCVERLRKAAGLAVDTQTEELAADLYSIVADLRLIESDLEHERAALPRESGA